MTGIQPNTADTCFNTLNGKSYCNEIIDVMDYGNGIEFQYRKR